MKFIETPSLEDINSLLDSIEFGDQAISGKLEAYSCAREDETAMPAMRCPNVAHLQRPIAAALSAVAAADCFCATQAR